MAELPQCPPFFSDRDALTSVAPACSSTFPSGFSFLWGPAARGGPHLLGKHGRHWASLERRLDRLPKLEVFLKAISSASCRSRLATCLRDDVTPGTQRGPAPQLLGMTSARASLSSPVSHQRGLRVVWLP